MTEVYYFTGKVPPWMQWMILEFGMPEEFIIEELTEEQKKFIQFLAALDKLKKWGLIEISFENEDIGPMISLTSKGRAFLKMLETP